jgi:hypothetical protein
VTVSDVTQRLRELRHCSNSVTSHLETCLTAPLPRVAMQHDNYGSIHARTANARRPSQGTQAGTNVLTERGSNGRSYGVGRRHDIKTPGRRGCPLNANATYDRDASDRNSLFCRTLPVMEGCNIRANSGNGQTRLNHLTGRLAKLVWRNVYSARGYRSPKGRGLEQRSGRGSVAPAQVENLAMGWSPARGVPPCA